ncbi:MAG: enoyl-CoA hydratase/isomerase family protein [Pseudomonadota bacterium]
MPFVRLEHDGSIATITLSRPERRNAVGATLWEQLRERLVEAADAPPRALLITGEGGHFSAGLDLKPDNPLLVRVLPVVQQRDAAGARALIQELKSVCDLVAAFPAPTIAAIEGACVGIGLELVLACDLRVASREAHFGLPELRLGLAPDLGGTVRLTRLVGPGRAALLALAGRGWSGTEAHHAGLVEVLCEPDAVLVEARRLAEDIQRGAPTGAQGVLHVIRTAQDLEISDALVLETEAGANALLSGEPLEGLAARAAHRRPAWDA